MKKGNKEMKYIKPAVLGVLFAVLFSITSAFAASAPIAPTGHDLGQWSLSLSGAGAVTTATPSHLNAGVNLELGHTGDLILPLEFGVRQGLGYGADGSSSDWSFSTHLYNDWTLVKLGNLEFDAGVNGGVTYGNTPLAWSVAPEAVARLWLLKNVNTFLRGEFPFDISSNGIHAENNVRLTFGLNIRF
jgi:hypothetical protein